VGEPPRGVEDPALGECVGCHPPHATGLKALVRAKTHFRLTQGKCSACHGEGDEASLEIDEVAERCRQCHPFEKELEEQGATIHDPVADLPHRHGAVDAGCSGCHEPHVAAAEHFLRAKGSALCGKCHDFADAREGIELHPPAEDCSECHAELSHGGQTPKSLSSTPPDLCLDCHDDPREAEGELHPALEEGCLVCHDPHAGFAPGFLKSQFPHAACVECHDDPLEGKAVIHAPVQKGCSTCHELPASDNAHLLSTEGDELCLGCHKTDSHRHTLDAERGLTKFPSSANFPRSGKNCAWSGCHAPHAADEGALYIQPQAKLCAVVCHQL
jgi:predicted CXXCH cytochrome family protein